MSFSPKKELDGSCDRHVPYASLTELDPVMPLGSVTGWPSGLSRSIGPTRKKIGTNRTAEVKRYG